ncbi:MAG: nucleotide exchange factor GrpE [Kiritimatiellae bacterium]|nr:nucleotide exchange factor GrpE [Kiritimatiellia bacterium]
MNDSDIPESGAPAEEEAIPADAPAPDEAAPEATPESDSGEPSLSPEEVLRDRLLRLQADFDNYRKRMAREKQDWIALASENVVKDLLPVLDHFALGLENVPATPEAAAVAEGFRLIRDQLWAALQKAGLEAVEPAAGDAFDPAVHEAITQLPSPDIPEGHIVARTRAGYRLGAKLLRPAQVVVSSGVPA